MTWKVKNPGMGPIILNHPDIKVDPNAVVDLDKIADRSILEKSRSIQVALSKKYLVELEKTPEHRTQTTIMVKDEKANNDEILNKIDNFKSEVLDKVNNIIDNRKSDSVSSEDLKNFQSTLLSEVKNIIKENVVSIERTSNGVPRPHNVRVIDKDEMELRKMAVSDVAKEYDSKKIEFGKTSVDKSSITDIANEIEKLL